jgi:hypothetical protein
MKKMTLLGFLIILFSCERDVDIAKLTFTLEKAELIFPEDQSECTTGKIISDTESEIDFNWSDVDGAEGYLLILTNLTSGEVTHFEPTESVLPSTLNRGTPYSWKILTYAENGTNVSESETASFYNAGPGIESFAPFPARAISPKNEEQLNLTNNGISLTWESTDLDNDLVDYHVYFGNDENPILHAENHTDNSVFISDVAPGTYFWRIVTNDAQGNSVSSEIFKFILVD